VERLDWLRVEGLKLFWRRWAPEEDAKGVVVLVPGAAEHTGRYEHVAERLNEAGYIVNGLDLRGLGRSDGEPFHLPDPLETYMDDLDHFLAAVDASEDPALPKFMLAHSMGGGVAARYMATRPDFQPAGVVLSGPLVGLNRRIPKLALELAIRLGQRAPRLRMPMGPPWWISRNKAVVAAYVHDPHVFHGPLRASVVASLIGAGMSAADEAPLVTQPFLLIHGTADKLVPVEAGQEFFERAGSKDKSIKLYPGLYHEVLNEPEREQVLDDVVGWLDARCARVEQASGQAAAST
jgi:alpha-beta hydrolase superfamily lysophospholipase